MDDPRFAETIGETIDALGVTVTHRRRRANTDMEAHDIEKEALYNAVQSE